MATASLQGGKPGFKRGWQGGKATHEAPFKIT